MANPIEKYTREYLKKKEGELNEYNKKIDEAHKMYTELMSNKMKNDNMEDVKKCISLGNKICNWFKIDSKYDRQIEGRIKREVLKQEPIMMSKISAYRLDRSQVPTILEKESIEQGLVNIPELEKMDKFKLSINNKCERFNIPVLCDVIFAKTKNELQMEHGEYCQRLYTNRFELINTLSFKDRCNIVKNIIDQNKLGAKINEENGYIYFNIGI